MEILTPDSFPSRFETRDNAIALTFDDGPNPPHTARLLDILSAQGVRASFFVVGRNAEKFPGVVKRISAAGHTVGNHLYSHNFLTNFSRPKFIEELDKTQEIINSITGTSPRVYRPPWLFRNSWQLEQAAKRNLVAVGGTFGFEMEIFQPGAQLIAARALQKSKPGRIMIFHDGVEGRLGNRAQTVEAMQILIGRLKDQAYKFVTLDEILI